MFGLIATKIYAVNACKDGSKLRGLLLKRDFRCSFSFTRSHKGFSKLLNQTHELLSPMDLLTGYDSDSGSDAAPELPSAASYTAPSEDYSTALIVNAAPDVIDFDKTARYADTRSGTLFYNPKFEEIQAPVAGPVNPADLIRRTIRVEKGQKATPTGYVEEHSMNRFAFDDQYNTYGKMLREAANEEKKRASEDWKGAWTETMKARSKAVAVGDKDKPATTAPAAAAASAAAAEGESKAGGVGSEKSVFHGKEQRDYQGRSWVEPPSDLKPHEHECFMPKVQIGQWYVAFGLVVSLLFVLFECVLCKLLLLSFVLFGDVITLAVSHRAGHEKGVAAIRFFPTYGHLLLSGGMDNKVKIWDATSSLGCKRVYMGHQRAVRDIQFSPDGRRFLSASYDRYVKEWDTETGQCLGAYTNSKMMYCAKYHPTEDSQFLTGCHDRKIYQVCSLSLVLVVIDFFTDTFFCYRAR